MIQLKFGHGALYGVYAHSTGDGMRVYRMAFCPSGVPFPSPGHYYGEKFSSIEDLAKAISCNKTAEVFTGDITYYGLPEPGKDLPWEPLTKEEIKRVRSLIGSNPHVEEADQGEIDVK